MEKISRKNWTFIWILGMAGQLCWNIENSWFNNFVYAKIAPSPEIVAWMVGVSAVVSTLCTFIVGTASDRRGQRKPFIAWGYILWGVFTIAFASTEYLPKAPLLLASGVILADAVMSFFGSMGYDGAFNPWTTDITNVKNRGSVSGALAVMPVFATIFGALCGGIIIEKFGFFAFFAATGVIVSVIGVWCLFTLKDDISLKPNRESSFIKQFSSVFNIKLITQNKELFWVFLVMMIYFIGFNVYFPFITVYFTESLSIDYGMAGIIQGVGLLAAAALTIPAAKLINKGSCSRIIALSVAFNLIGLLIVSATKNIPLLLLGVFGAGTGYVLVLQSLTAWIKNLYPEKQRGQFEGIKQVFFVCLPMIFGPMIATPVINNFGVKIISNGIEGMSPSGALFLVSAVVTLLCLAPLAFAFKHEKKRLSISSTPTDAI